MKKNECRSCFYGDCTEAEYPCCECITNTSNFESHSNKYKYLQPGNPYSKEQYRIDDERLKKNHPKIWTIKHVLGKIFEITFIIIIIIAVIKGLINR